MDAGGKVTARFAGLVSALINWLFAGRGRW